MPHRHPSRIFLIIVYSVCGAILLAVVIKRSYDTYHGYDPTWNNTEQGIHPDKSNHE